MTPVDTLPDPPILERRREADRRTRTARSRPTLLPTPWQDGWIVFEQQPEGSRPSDAVVETRRLAPIPDEWAGCSEAELARHLERAIGHRAHGHQS